jgi:hypothetical protein
MRALSAADLLTVWERGLTQSLAQRALTLLALACAETPAEQVAQFNIGQRDMLLLALREQTFGSQLASIATCPACAAHLELSVNATDIRSTPSEDLDQILEVAHTDYTVQFRLPNSLDLATLDPASDGETNRQQLLQRCVLTAQRADKEIATAELPADVGAAIAQGMAEADPQANVQLALTCPQCRHAWQTSLDIVSYFWAEIHAWASRILREVHALASAYGWSEAEVLALTPYRRQAYLEMIEP